METYYNPADLAFFSDDGVGALQRRSRRFRLTSNPIRTSLVTKPKTDGWDIGGARQIRELGRHANPALGSGRKHIARTHRPSTREERATT